MDHNIYNSIKLHDRGELILMQFSTTNHVVEPSVDRPTSVRSRSDDMQTAPQQPAWESPCKAWKAQSWITWACFFHCWMKNALVTIWSDAEGAAQIFFFSFNSKTFWGFTERGCLSVCSLLSWLIRKNKLRLGFWTSDFSLILCVLLTSASPFVTIQRACLALFAPLNTTFQRYPLNSTNY